MPSGLLLLWSSQPESSSASFPTGPRSNRSRLNPLLEVLPLPGIWASHCSKFARTFLQSDRYCHRRTLYSLPRDVSSPPLLGASSRLVGSLAGTSLRNTSPLPDSSALPLNRLDLRPHVQHLSGE